MPATDRAARALDTRLAALRLPERPPKGWLRAIRDALGVTTRQFATRLGVTQSRVVALERAETEGSVSLATLRRAAEALECTLVYALVPKRPLVDVLRRRAELKADAQLARLNHTMSLENQAASDEELCRQRELLIDELLRGNLSRLWDEAP
jgi:predicted DNA-binding mobile mystery protein A